MAESSELLLFTYKVQRERQLNLLEFILPDYEKNCLLENDEKKKKEKLLFVADEFELKEAIGDFKKSSEYPPPMLAIEEIKR